MTDDTRLICTACGYEKRHHNEDGTAHLLGSEEPCDFATEIPLHELADAQRDAIAAPSPESPSVSPPSRSGTTE